DGCSGDYPALSSDHVPSQCLDLWLKAVTVVCRMEVPSTKRTHDCAQLGCSGLFRLNGFFVYRDMNHDDERKGALADLEAGPDRYDSRNHVPDHRPATGPSGMY